MQNSQADVVYVIMFG